MVTGATWSQGPAARSFTRCSRPLVSRMSAGPLRGHAAARSRPPLFPLPPRALGAVRAAAA
eukprot:250244-Alexandrium_andersonii.AAC.1